MMQKMQSGGLTAGPLDQSVVSGVSGMSSKSKKIIAEQNRQIVELLRQIEANTAAQNHQIGSGGQESSQPPEKSSF